MKEGGKSEGFSFVSWTEHLILWSLILHGEEWGEKNQIASCHQGEEQGGSGKVCTGG